MAPALRLRSISPVDDAAALGRHFRDLAVDGTSQIAKRIDVPHLVEAGRDSAATAVSDAVDRVTGRRRRSRPVGPVVGVAVLVALGLGAWLLLRSGILATLRSVSGDDVALDGNLGADADQAQADQAQADQTQDALARATATDDGMGQAWDKVDDISAVPELPENGFAELTDTADTHPV